MSRNRFFSCPIHFWLKITFTFFRCQFFNTRTGDGEDKALAWCAGGLGLFPATSSRVSSPRVLGSGEKEHGPMIGLVKQFWNEQFMKNRSRAIYK